MEPSAAEASTCRLVPFDDRFLDASYTWLNDPEIMRLTRGRPFTREAQRAWYAGLPGRADYRIWGIEVDGRPVGAVGLKHVSGSEAELFIYLGERDVWGRGVGVQAVRAVLELAPPGVRRVWLEVGADNTRAVRLYRSLGFGDCGSGDGTLLMELRLSS